MNFLTILDEIKDFFSKFKVGQDVVYQKQLTSVFSGESSKVTVDLDDIYSFNEPLCERIEENTLRFTNLFYQVVDENVEQSNEYRKEVHYEY